MIIGVKGKIGSGKTTLSKFICEKYDYIHFNCDECISRFYQDDEIKIKICELLDLKTFNLADVRNIVFEDQQLLKKLELFFYELLEIEITKLLEYNKNIVIDGVNVEMLNVDYDLTLIASADVQTLIQRVIKRDMKSEEQIRKILNIQTNHYVLKNRTYTINTESNYEILIEKIIGGLKDD